MSKRNLSFWIRQELVLLIVVLEEVNPVQLWISAVWKKHHLNKTVLDIWRFSALFSADSENTKNTSADERCFRPDQLWFSLNQRCSELKNSALNSTVSERISFE